MMSRHALVATATYDACAN